VAPVVICGAGAAGLAAALSAAKTGARVLLVEASGRLGGTVIAALIHTLAGLYDSQGRLINGGLPGELVERLTLADDRVGPRKIGRAWVLNVCPQIYRKTVEAWVAGQSRISVLNGTRIVEVHCRGDRIASVALAGPHGPLRVLPWSVVDATGTAEVIRCVDPSLVDGEAPTTAGGFIMRIGGAAPGAAMFPRNVAVIRAIREAAANGQLPPSCAHVWIDRGFYDDEVYVKLPVPLDEDWRERRQAIEQTVRRLQGPLLTFLQELPGFRETSLVQCGAIGIREGGRIRGEYRLTGDDVREMRRFPDAVCRCAWPIEFWHSDRGVSLEYLPEGGYYEVPMRCLKPQGLANVWAAGKCLSADPLAQASARVVGCCWAMGEAAGHAAASV
jgi:hypothetical protein